MCVYNAANFITTKDSLKSHFETNGKLVRTIIISEDFVYIQIL